MNFLIGVTIASGVIFGKSFTTDQEMADITKVPSARNKMTKKKSKSPMRDAPTKRRKVAEKERARQS